MASFGHKFTMTPKRVLFVTPSPRKRARVSSVVKKNRVRMIRPKFKKSSKKVSIKRRLKKTGISSFGRPESKQVMTLDQDVVSIGTRTWGAVNLMQISQIAAGAIPQMNTRIGREVSVAGILHKVTWRNNTDKVLKVYEYWVIPLQYNSDTVNDAALQDDFFSVHGGVNDNDRTWLPTLPSMIFDEPVNPNKYTVLKKRVTKLGPGSAVGTTGNYGNLSSLKYHKTYIPINRKYTYGHAQDSESALNTLQPPVFYITFIIDQMTPNGTTVTAAAVSREAHIVTYFRDGESGLGMK